MVKAKIIQRIAAIVILQLAAIHTIYAEIYSTHTPSSLLRYERIDQRHGFIQNSIHAIYQDKRGYIYYGTPNGAFQYDGYNFFRHTRTVGNDNTLAYNFVNNIDAAQEDEIWFLNFRGINRYEVSEDKFYRYKFPEFGNLVFRKTVVDRKNSNRLWVLTQNNIGCISLNAKTKEVESVEYPLIKRQDGRFQRVQNITASQRGGVYFLIGGDIQYITFNESSKQNEISASLSTERYTSFAEGKDKALYATTHRAIYRMQLCDDGTFSTPELLHNFKNPQNRNVQIQLSKYDDLVCFVWGEGIIHIDLKSENKWAEHYPTFKNNPDFQGASFGDALIDESGILWLGTFHAGLFKINLHQRRFNSLEGRNPKYRYFANAITGDNKGNIWVGTHQRGLMHIREENGKVLSYQNSDKGYNIASNASIYMLNYIEGSLWIHSDNKIIRHEIDSKGRVTATYTIDKGKYALSNTNCHFVDSEGILWLGEYVFNSGGIFYIDTKRGKDAKLEVLTLADGDDSRLYGNISAIMRDSDKNLWFSTTNAGIYIAKLKDMKIESVERINFSGKLDGVDVNSSMCMYEDSSRNVWIGLFGGGFAKIAMDKRDKPEDFEHYTTNDGLADDGVYSIMSDASGNLWISNDGGLSRFTPSTKSFRNYDMADGINNLNFRKWSAWRDNSGRLYFGGSNGITTFSPKEIEDNIHPPKVNITTLHSSQEKILINEYLHYSDATEQNKNNILRLKPSQNSLQFTFAAMQFDNPEQISYYYRLKGIEKEWNESSAAHRHASYSYLRPGDYTFEVEAKTRDGARSLSRALINIHIAPRWYQTWWARLLFLALIIAAIYLYMRIMQHKRELQNAIAHEALLRENQIMMNQAKLEFYTNISHEIKTPLTIMSGVANNYLRSGKESMERRDFYTIVRNIYRMLQLVTQLLDFRRAVTGHMPFTPLRSDIVAFMYELMDNFELYLRQKEFCFKFSSSHESIEVDFDPDKINKIMSNLLSNAIKYSDKSREIDISLNRGTPQNTPSHYAISPTRDYVTITVSDKGVGISENDLENIFNRFFQASSEADLTSTDKGVGVGLSFVKLLVEAHEGYIFAESKLGVGSKFYVVLPTTQVNAEVAEGEDKDSIIAQIVAQSRNSILSENMHVSSPTPDITESTHINDYEILIVEDNAEIRQFVKEFLAPKYKVLEAENGQMGLDMAIEHIPDLIITDVMMPIMDGMEMTNHIKNEQKTNHIPVIMLTVNNHIDNRIDGLKAGADSYITKPFNVEHLQIRIEKLLELRNTLKDKYLSVSGDKKLSEIDINEEDKNFLAELERILEENLSDSEFTVNEIERIMGYSRMQFYRKVKSITGLPSVEYVRNYRLRRSVDMMHTTNKQIREILYDVGFSSPSYYSKCFKNRYSMTPKEFLAKIRV